VNAKYQFEMHVHLTALAAQYAAVFITIVIMHGFSCLSLHRFLSACSMTQNVNNFEEQDLFF